MLNSPYTDTLLEFMGMEGDNSTAEEIHDLLFDYFINHESPLTEGQIPEKYKKYLPGLTKLGLLRHWFAAGDEMYMGTELSVLLALAWDETEL